MGEYEKSSFWDLLIWMTVLGAGTFGLIGLLEHVTGLDWMKVVFFFIGLSALVWEAVRDREGNRPAQPGASRKPDKGTKIGPLSLKEALAVVSAAVPV